MEYKYFKIFYTGGVKYFTVTQDRALGCVAKDKTSISLAEQKLEVWGMWPPKKNHGKKWVLQVM